MMNEPIMGTMDFFDHIPSKEEKIEMRKSCKSPSEWLRLLCRDWALENGDIVEATDLKFLGYKSYLKGRLSSQLLCRLSIPDPPADELPGIPAKNVDFWGVLGITDEFDKSYIISQIERFCAVYSIRAVVVDDDLLDQSLDSTTSEADAAIVMAHTTGAMNNIHHHYILPTPMGTKDPRFIPTDQRELKQREREAAQFRKAADKAARDASREEKRQKKLKLRQSRELMIRQQKEAALARAEELVKSNRVPIEITRGAAAAQAAADAAVAMMGVKTDQEYVDGSKKKQRSDIVVSTASDLDRIVTHAKNLWTKYNAIAKEHNQKVNWATVAKELGIHVKVREKYARMHARALQRGFDFKTCGYFKIKENPQIFLEPIQRKAKSPNESIYAKDLEPHVHSHHEHNHISDDQVAAAVDAAIKETAPVAPDDLNCYEEAAATVDNVINTTNGNEEVINVQSVVDATQAALAVGQEHVIDPGVQL